MLKHQMFQQLHAAFINGRVTTSSHDHNGHVTQVGGVTALFTSIPVGDAVAVIKGKLEQDIKLQGRCELSHRPDSHPVGILREHHLLHIVFCLQWGILQTDHRSTHGFTCVTKPG